MTRFFINQEGSSNKFWNIRTDGKSQIITFGRINSEGRQAVKLFETEEDCEVETEKLISSKIKKGYVEVKDGDFITEKTSLSDDEAGKKFFWDSIEKSNKNKSDYDIDEHLENLTRLLAKNSKQKLIQFEKNFQQNLDKLYKAEIAELYIILWNEFNLQNGHIVFDDYVSNDGFIYFRCWVLLKGREFFDEVLKDINAVLSEKYTFDIEETWAEDLLYVADKAYSINHDNKDDFEISDAVSKLFPEVVHYDSMEQQIDRDLKSGTELEKAYPKLVRAITNIRKQKS